MKWNIQIFLLVFGVYITPRPTDVKSILQAAVDRKISSDSLMFNISFFMPTRQPLQPSLSPYILLEVSLKREKSENWGIMPYFFLFPHQKNGILLPKLF
jgi:hypothetical protein